IVVAEAADDRIGLLNLNGDRESTIAEQLRQCIQVFPYRGLTRTYPELRWREAFEMTAHEVKPFRGTYNFCFLFTQAETPSCQEVAQPGEDDSFQLPAGTSQDHEVVGVAN